MICRLLSGAYLWMHRRVYERRRRSARRFPAQRVISIGNLSAGGTGKTPLTIALAEELRRQGASVLVCLRGYGGSDRSGTLVADSRGVHRSAREAGDEAVLIGRRLGEQASSVPFAVAAGPDRACLIERYGEGFLYVLLDDAFQNPTVHRDLDIVLLDASVHPDEMRLLPCGRFREPFSALSRAHVVVVTRSDLFPENADLYERRIAEAWPGIAVQRSGLDVGGVVPVRSVGSVPIPRRGAGVAAFCGIGNADSFFRLVTGQGFVLCESRAFDDHHRFSMNELRECGRSGLPTLTTEKDVARLDTDMELAALFPGGLFFVRVDFRLPGKRPGLSVLDILGPVAPAGRASVHGKQRAQRSPKSQRSQKGQKRQSQQKNRKGAHS